MIVILRKLKQNKKSDDMVTEYANSLIKACDVQTVELKLQKYKSWQYALYETKLDYKRSSSVLLGC